MAGLVFAAIAPHGSLAIPLIAGPDGSKATATQQAMVELGRRCALAQPETVVLITPHGLTVEGTFALLNTRWVAGDLHGAGQGIHLEFAVDQPLNDAIVGAAADRNVPVVRVGYGPPESPDFRLPLDFGAVVPLSFCIGNDPPPQVVILCAGPGLYRDAVPESGHRRDVFLRLGGAIGAAIARCGRRVAFIASADLGHAHDAGSRYGFDPASAEFDALVREAVELQDLGRLLAVDAGWLQRARTDAFVQLLTLHGVLGGTHFRGRLLSYEVPTYYGMLCAAYEGVESRPLEA